LKDYTAQNVHFFW